MFLKNMLFDFLKTIKLNGDGLVEWKMVGGSKITARIDLKVIRKFNNQIVFEAQEGQLL